MTFGVDMAEMASELVAEFSTEIGVSTLREVTGEVYDPVTGSNVPAYKKRPLFCLCKRFYFDIIRIL